MSAGFGAEKTKDGKAVVVINDNEIKKYMKSSLYTVQTMDGIENSVSKLLKEYSEEEIN